MLVDHLLELDAVIDGLIEKYAHEIQVVLFILEQGLELEFPVKILKIPDHGIVGYKNIVGPVHVLLLENGGEILVLTEMLGDQSNHEIPVFLVPALTCVHIRLVKFATFNVAKDLPYYAEILLPAD